jgi:hypothetical protein
MVKLTADLIAKQAPGHNKRRADETVEHYLSRLTHLPFQDRGIDSIVTPIFPSLIYSVLFLFIGYYSSVSSINCDLSL